MADVQTKIKQEESNNLQIPPDVFIKPTEDPLSNEDFDDDGLSNKREEELGTDPNLADTDGDGLSDGNEVNFYLTNANSRDTDGDSIPDGWEAQNDLDPLLAADAGLDPDSDSLTNFHEYVLGTNLNLDDSDLDGIRDDWEVRYSLNPLLASDSGLDGDGDGLTNLQEFLTNNFPNNINSNNDPNNISDGDEDPDMDGLSNHQEFMINTDPLKRYTNTTGITDGDEDFDGDGLNNIQEFIVGTDPLIRDSNGNGIDDGHEDFDGDGLDNIQEFIVASDPFLMDTNSDGVLDGDEDFDGDQMPNYWEFLNGFNPSLVDDGHDDSDGDGLSNAVEFFYGTDPYNPDSDGDTLHDGDEVNTSHTDPLLYDTDADGASDADELYRHESDPLKINTFIEYASSANFYDYVSPHYGHVFIDIPGERFAAAVWDLTDRGGLLEGGIDDNASYDMVTHDLAIEPENYSPYSIPVRNENGGLLTNAMSLLDTTPDGQTYLLATNSTDLLNGEGGVYQELFIYNVFTKKYTSWDQLVEFNGSSYNAKISSDGRFLVYSTDATNLYARLDYSAGNNLMVGDDGNSFGNGMLNDVYIKNVSDLISAPILLSRSNVQIDINTPATSNGYSDYPQISANGEVVIFLSDASDINLSSGTNSNNGMPDLFLYRKSTNSIERITESSTGDTENYEIMHSTLAKDGRSVVFYTQRNLLGLGVAPATQLYYYDVVSRETFLISKHYLGTGYGNTGIESQLESPRVSSDGRYVLYVSDDKISDVGDVNNAKDVVLWDRLSQINRVVTQNVFSENYNRYEKDPFFRDNPDLGLGNVFTTFDFEYLYATFNNPEDVITPDGDCGFGVGCLYKLSLFLPQTDTDNDGLNDRQELAIGSDLNNADTDGDGIDDHEEIYFYHTSPLKIDSDEDGIPDNKEAFFGTSPIRSDSDGDGLNDYDEINVHGTDPWNPDSDGDGLNDGEEINMYLTDPLDQDSDGDGHTDYSEVVVYSTDPNDPSSVPAG